MLRYITGADAGHRAHFRGVVTLNWPGTYLFIREESAGAQISNPSPEQTTGLKAGDLVDVAGFPAFGNYTPVYRGGPRKTVGIGGTPSAVPITAQDALTGGHDASLVRLWGRLISVARGAKTYALVIGSGDTLYTASLPTAMATPALIGLRPGVSWKSRASVWLRSGTIGN
jgi:hypothetical protein